MKYNYVYQCYFYVFIGSNSYYRRVTKCGPIYSSYEMALHYLEILKENEKNFCTGFIYEFILDVNSYYKLIYTTDPSIDNPEIFSEIHNNQESFILNR